jgi:hypothetical protein
MSITEIRQVWEMHRQQGLNLNINCGDLRRIGKTQFLRELIVQWKDLHPTHSISIWTQTPDIGQEYIDLRIDRTVEYLFNFFDLQCRGIRGMMRERELDVFSDEIPNAEEMIRRHPHLHFIAGVYSIVPIHQRQEDLTEPIEEAQRQLSPLEEVFEEQQKRFQWFDIIPVPACKDATFNKIIDKVKIRFQIYGEV